MQVFGEMVQNVQVIGQNGHHSGQSMAGIYSKMVYFNS